MNIFTAHKFSKTAYFSRLFDRDHIANHKNQLYSKAPYPIISLKAGGGGHERSKKRRIL